MIKGSISKIRFLEFPLLHFIVGNLVNCVEINSAT